MKRIGYFIILLALAIPAVRPLFDSGYFSMHDDTQVSRVIEMGRALKNGQFPVRWVGDLGYGYGYPIYNFYGPLPYYIGGLLYVFGVPAVLATKLMFGIGILFPVITAFIMLSSLLGPSFALLSSVALLYAPYHAVEIFVRGAVGEYWVIGFWPLILWAYLSKNDAGFDRKNAVLGALGVAGAVLSHTLLGYVTVLFAAIGCTGLAVYRIRHKEYLRMGYEAGILIGGLLLSAFFWIPAFFEMRFTDVAGQVSATADYRDHFVCLSQLWSSQWGFGGSSKGCIDGLSFMLGKLQILLALLGVSALLFTRKKHAVVIAGLILAVAGIFFSLPISAPLWHMLPEFAYLQYPWRFLAVAFFGLAIVVGFSLGMLPNKYRPIASVVISLLLVGMSMKWFVPQYRVDTENSVYESSGDLRWRVSKISDEYLPKSVLKPRALAEVVSDTIASASGLSVTVIRETETEGRFVVSTPTDRTITLNKAYFPGWIYQTNGKTVAPTIVHGLPTIPVTAGQTRIDAVFTDTPVRMIGNMLSLITLLGMGILLYGTKRKNVR